MRLRNCTALLAAALSGCIGDANPSVLCGTGTELQGNVCVRSADAPDTEPPDAATGGGRADMGTAPLGTASVLTQHNDIARTGANLQETLLTTSNVNPQQFGKLYSLAVDDQVYSQPLLMHDLVINGVARDVLFVATVNDTVYAFDAADPLNTDPLWQSSLLPDGAVPPRNTDMTGACGGSYTDYSGNIGIVGTPVIDPDTGTLYAVARSKEAGKFVQRLHALDVHTGAERAGSPVAITASVPGNGDGSIGGMVAFDPLHENQRSGLLLAGGVVYITWAGHCDWSPYHGWILGYDAKTLHQAVVYNDTPGGGDGGIWMSGGAPAADAQGNIYVASGNGTVGAGGNPSDLTNRGESFMKLARNGTSLSISSWFTPANYQQADDSDIDFGTTGVLLVPGSTLAVAGAKNSILYVVDRDNMGGVSSVPNDPQIVQSIDLGGWGIYGTPAFWSSPQGPMLYTWPSNGALAALLLDTKLGRFGGQPVAQHNETAAPLQAVLLSVSANGATAGSGILWASHALKGNPNQHVQPGILRAFDAGDVTNELWNSEQSSDRDAVGSFGKFGYPTVVNGRVYLPTFSNEVLVYGLLGVPDAPTALTAVATPTNGVNLTWHDNSGGKASFAIERSADGVQFAPIGTVAQGKTFFGDLSTLIPYATYYYRVRAVRGDKASNYSNVASVVLDAGPHLPSLIVSGNMQPIAAGATTPAVANLTEFVSAGGKVTHSFTVTNRGAAALSFPTSGAVTISGAGASVFSIDHPPAGPLAPGASDSLTVSFTPPPLGDVLATITISSNDPSTPVYSFTLGGVGPGTLVGWWQLDDGSGTTAVDSSGVGANGTFVGAPSWTDGHVGGALALSGQSAVQVAPVAALSPTGAITVAAWLNPSSPLGGGANPRVAQKGRDDNQYRLLVENGQLKFDIDGVGTASTTTLPPATMWTHVAGTYDGAHLTIFINGQPLATVAATGAIPVTNDPLILGAKWTTGAAGDFFQGRLDDVRIYSRALSAAELQALVGGGNPDGGAPLDGGADLSSGYSVHFAADVQPIFDAHCSGCHDSGGLTLTAGMSYASIVGVASGEQPSFPFVHPSDADGSYLYAKIAGSTPEITITGSIMPRGSPMLAPADIATIQQWIAEGAPNN